MKKQLLISTALVAAIALAPAAMAGAKPKLSLGGYFDIAVGAAVSKDDPAGAFETSALDVHSESEVHVNGSVKLDNGVSISVRWEIEGDGDGAPGPNNDPLDEVYARIKGSFGQIEIGSIDNAASRMLTGFSGSWPTAVGQNMAFDAPEWTNAAFGIGTFGTQRDSRINDGGDAEKINYYTPRMNGFQLGASYMPNSQEQNSDQGGDIGGAPADADGLTHDGYSVAVNYVGKMGSIGIGGGIGYAHSQAPETTVAGTTNDEKLFGAALRLDMGPIRISGGYKRRASSNGGDLRGRIIDLGAKYSMGANSVSLVYGHGQMQTSVAAGNDGNTAKTSILSFARKLGPGVKWAANALYVDSTLGATSSGGTAVSTNLRISF